MALPGRVIARLRRRQVSGQGRTHEGSAQAAMGRIT